MKKHTVTFKPSGRTADIEEGKTILEAARSAGVHLNQVCGGEGTCGKCRVKILRGQSDSPSSPHLSRREENEGLVLACLTSVLSDLTVEVPRESRADESREGGEETSRRFRDWAESGLEHAGYPLDPLVRKIHLHLSPPDLDDNLDDLARITLAVKKNTGAPAAGIDGRILSSLPHRLRERDWDITVTLGWEGDRTIIHRVEAGDTAAVNYGVAVDIGTTTVAAHLVDLVSGRTCRAAACYNSQISFGEDVIRRIIVSEENGLPDLSRTVREDINRLIGELAAAEGIDRNDINALICSGNSTMISLFLEISPAFIRREPYIPPFAAPPPDRAGRLGIQIFPGAPVYTVPGIAGWVGGDITAGILAAGIRSSDEISLLVDVGTNGEIVIGNREWQLSCSCSAGPAFEGSGISCGMRAARGAVERVRRLGKNTVDCRTIGNCPPAGICGSGLLDIIYHLFCSGILGRDGKLDPESGSFRLKKIDGELSFLVADAGESATGKPIAVTQADIDNLIRAKAAVYAGVKVLLNTAGIQPAQLDRVFIAGGFGNYLNIKEAVGIGLLPDIPYTKIHFIGNGALRGAKLILLSRRAEREAEDIARSTTYFELSTENNFMEEYTRALFIPHTDIEDFPGSCR